MTDPNYKIDRIGFISAFQYLLVKSEAKHIRKFRSYFKKEYYKAIDDFIQSRSVRSYPDLFTQNDLENLYVEMYIDIAKRFYKWYAKNFESYIKKQYQKLQRRTSLVTSYTIYCHNLERL